MSGLLPPNTAERALMNAARKGKEIDLARFSTDGKGKALIRAEFLRALILQKDGLQVHERGIRFRNARIRHQLDLSHCRVDFPLVMRNCEFGDNANDIIPLNICGGAFHFFDLKGSKFYGSNPGGVFFAERARLAASMILDNCVFSDLPLNFHPAGT